MDTRHFKPTQSMQYPSPCFNTFGLHTPVLLKVKVIWVSMGIFRLCFFSLGVHKLTTNFSLALYLVFYYFVIALFIGVCR